MVQEWQGGFLGDSVMKNLPANEGDAGDGVWSLGREGALEKEMAMLSSILAWRILWNLACYSPRGHKESDTT